MNKTYIEMTHLSKTITISKNIKNIIIMKYSELPNIIKMIIIKLGQNLIQIQNLKKEVKQETKLKRPKLLGIIKLIVGFQALLIVMINNEGFFERCMIKLVIIYQTLKKNAHNLIIENNDDLKTHFIDTFLHHINTLILE